MPLRIPQLALLLALLASLCGCATSSTRLASVRTVAVSYEQPRVPGRSGAIAGRVARHGAGYALGQFGFIGGLVGLGWDIAGIATPSRETDVSPIALRALYDAGASPLSLVARRTEQEITRRRVFAIAATGPDAILDLKLQRLQFEAADSIGLGTRATLAVSARLRDRRGTTLWRKEAAASSTRSRSWRAYEEQPRLVRTEFDALAAAVARQLAADLASRKAATAR